MARNCIGRSYRQSFISQREKVVQLVQELKKSYYEEKLSSGSMKETYAVIKELSNSDESKLPSGEPAIVAQYLANFFEEKIVKIRRFLDEHSAEEDLFIVPDI